MYNKVYIIIKVKGVTVHRNIHFFCTIFFKDITTIIKRGQVSEGVCGGGANHIAVINTVTKYLNTTD